MYIDPVIANKIAEKDEKQEKYIRLDRIQERLERQKEKLVNLNKQIELMLNLQNDLENGIKDIEQMQEITKFVLPNDKSWHKK